MDPLGEGRSSSGIAAIASRQAWASSAFFAPPRPEDRSSSARAFIAAFSASVKPALSSVVGMTTSSRVSTGIRPR
jgi:hypothetical protein